MAKIFISYRHDDSAGHAGRLYDGLVREYGSDQVFMDRVDIGPGADFAEVIARESTGSDVLLAIIGSRWLDARDGSGRRRLDDPRDVLRRELEAGLARGGRTIAVLVDGAPMPDASRLPRSLHGLLKQNALELSDSRWSYDFARLVEALGPIFGLSGLLPMEPRMLLIPEGPFLMGADPTADPYADDLERPRHEVDLPDYYISKLPITDDRFRAYLEEDPYQAKHLGQLATIQGQIDRARGRTSGAGAALVPGQGPVRFAFTTFDGARGYCRWLSGKTGRLYRLPNEAEWEKAVRGTDGRIYPWGNRWPEEAGKKKGDRRLTGPHGLLHAVGSSEWAWTRRRYVHEEREREGVVERLRFWKVPTGRRVVTNYPYEPGELTDATWRRGRLGSGALSDDHVRRGGGAWTPESARCTAREFDPLPFSGRAAFRVVLSRHQVRRPVRTPLGSP